MPIGQFPGSRPDAPVPAGRPEPHPGDTPRGWGRLLSLACGLLVVTVAACAAPTGPAAPRSTSGTVGASPTALSPGAPPQEALGAQDVAFLQSMIPDDLQTLAMTSQAADHARSDEVRGIADHLDRARSDDVDRISAILIDHGQPRPRPGERGPIPAAGYFDEDRLAHLAVAGTRFDRDFLRMMLDHERGALQLSETEVGSGRAPGVLALARSLGVALRLEIGTLQDALTRLP